MSANVHLGQLMEERLIEIGMTKAEFARRMGVSRQKVNTWKIQPSFDVKLLLQMGKILNKDFLAELVLKPKPAKTAKRYLLQVEVDRDKRDEIIEQIP